MGTRLRATVAAPTEEAATAAIETVFAEVRRLEAVLSSWRGESELSRLNSAPVGAATDVSAELFGLLQEVRGWSEASGGAIDPAVGALIDAWGLRGDGRRPSEDELSQALSWSGRDAFELDEGSSRVTRRAEGGWITAGAFGKGAALRSAVGLLRRAGVESALFDFGGQIAAVGTSPEGSAWTVGVAHPSRRDRAALELRLENVSAATSGASERYVEVDGQRFGHVLDPRSGRPVAAWGSATAVAADPMVADLVSTAVFVLGPEAGLRWADTLDGVGVLVLSDVEGHLSVNWNESMRAWLATGSEDER
jgi:thiamine biosynthesis lipoprotein